MDLEKILEGSLPVFKKLKSGGFAAAAAAFLAAAWAFLQSGSHSVEAFLYLLATYLLPGIAYGIYAYYQDEPFVKELIKRYKELQNALNEK